MPTDRNGERVPWDMAAGAEPPEDWLDTVIRWALRSSAGSTEPSPAIWIRIRQNIAILDLSLSHEEENSAMLSHKHFLVQQEHYKDLLREAEHERLIQAAGLQQPSHWRLHRKVAGWIGAQMVRWGWKLQSYGTTPPPHCLQGAGDH